MREPIKNDFYASYLFTLIDMPPKSWLNSLLILILWDNLSNVLVKSRYIMYTTFSRFVK